MLYNMSTAESMLLSAHLQCLLLMVVGVRQGRQQLKQISMHSHKCQDRAHARNSCMHHGAQFLVHLPIIPNLATACDSFLQQ